MKSTDSVIILISTEPVFANKALQTVRDALKVDDREPPITVVDTFLLRVDPKIEGEYIPQRVILSEHRINETYDLLSSELGVIPPLPWTVPDLSIDQPKYVNISVIGRGNTFKSYMQEVIYEQLVEEWGISEASIQISSLDDTNWSMDSEELMRLCRDLIELVRDDDISLERYLNQPITIVRHLFPRSESMDPLLNIVRSGRCV